MQHSQEQLVNFTRESNKIEGILRDPTHQEVAELKRFLELKKITINDLKNFVEVYQPGTQIRNKIGMDVRIGRYLPPFGGPEIEDELQAILDSDDNAYQLHIAYEQLHPFMDGNGRSGRALWAWKKRDLSLGFLHAFYYETLSYYSFINTKTK